MNRATLAGIGAALRYAFPLPEEPLQWEAGDLIVQHLAERTPLPPFLPAPTIQIIGGPGQCLAPCLASTATQPFSRAPEISSDPPRKEEPMTLGKCQSCGEPFAFRRGEPWLEHYRGRAPAKRFCSEQCRKREEARRYRLRKHRGGFGSLC
jgi:hypothetical protein